MSSQDHRLSPEELRWTCSTSDFSFRSTLEIPPLKGIVEQERPVRAIRFGLDIASPGYNIYVSGLTGTGKTTVIKSFLDEIARRMRTPDDWCYVYNFRDPNSPTALSLPAGKARALQTEMDDLVRYLRGEIPKAFESKEYEQNMSALVRENQEKQQAIFEELEETVRKGGFAIELSKAGVALFPIADGKRISPEQYAKLDEQSREEIESRQEAVQPDINVFLRRAQEINKASREKVNELRRRIGMYVVGDKIEGIKALNAGLTRVQAYLDEVRDQILSH